jgi:hypothetical protein
MIDWYWLPVGIAAAVGLTLLVEMWLTTGYIPRHRHDYE